MGTLLIGSGFGVEAIGISIPGELRFSAISIGFGLYILSFIANERKKDRDTQLEKMRKEAEAQRRTDDMTMRRAKLEAGGDPADDKTIFRPPE